MNVYYLRVDPEVLGDIPQDSRVIGEYNFNHPFSVWNARDLNKIDRVIFPKGLMLSPRAKFSDLTTLNAISFPFLVFSESFAEVLNQFKLPEGKWGEVALVKGVTKRKYRIFCAYEPSFDHIHFKKSSFTLYDKTDRSFTNIDINSKEDYDTRSKTLTKKQLIRCLKPVFDANGNVDDLFYLPRGINGATYMVTERLKKALEVADLKGLKFVDAPCQ